MPKSRWRVTFRTRPHRIILSDLLKLTMIWVDTCLSHWLESDWPDLNYPTFAMQYEMWLWGYHSYIYHRVCMIQWTYQAYKPNNLWPVSLPAGPFAPDRGQLWWLFKRSNVTWMSTVTVHRTLLDWLFSEKSPKYPIGRLDIWTYDGMDMSPYMCLILTHNLFPLDHSDHDYNYL